MEYTEQFNYNSIIYIFFIDIGKKKKKNETTKDSYMILFQMDIVNFKLQDQVFLIIM